jgi:hypothetical protein
MFSKRGREKLHQRRRLEDLVAWMMRCECGEVARAETDEQLISAVERHIAEQHPEMVGLLTREQILGMAEVV